MKVNTLEEGLSQRAFDGKRVLVRVDFNVPLGKGEVTDDLRIRAALPTIQKLVDVGARVVLCSHLGRPGGSPQPDLSLAPVAQRLSELLGRDVAFASDCIGKEAETAAGRLGDGAVLLLENLRFHEGETTNDAAFADALASVAHVYVNDAFGTVHRAHASTVGVATRLPAYAGLLIEKELRILGGALREPGRPFTAILGGAKISDKLAVIEALIETDPRVDRLIIGGGMAFTFLKAQGHEVGKSLVEESRLDYARDMLGRAMANGVEVLLPLDVEEARGFHVKADHRAVKVGHQDPDWMGLDIGPHTIALFSRAIVESKTVLWNGPMGVFEWDSFQFGTRAVAQAMADCTGTTIVGGGDSASAARKFGVVNQVTHVSTGGGASLEFMEGKELPGIVALEQAKTVDA